jgi:putative transposase
VADGEVRGHLLEEYRSIAELLRGLTAYFTFYNEERLHEALGYRTPAAVYHHG